MNDKLLEQYEELKTLVESLQIDLVKNASGNKSAGARARKALLEMTKTGKELRKKIQDIKNTSK